MSEVQSSRKARRRKDRKRNSRNGRGEDQLRIHTPGQILRQCQPQPGYGQWPRGLSGQLLMRDILGNASIPPFKSAGWSIGPRWVQAIHTALIRASTYLNSRMQGKLRVADWLISASLPEFNHLGGCLTPASSFLALFFM